MSATRQTPAARALIGCLALRSGSTVNEALKLAGYDNQAASPLGGLRCARVVTRNGRIVKVTRNAYRASDWLTRMGNKLEAIVPDGFDRQRSGHAMLDQIGTICGGGR